MFSRAPGARRWTWRTPAPSCVRPLAAANFLAVRRAAAVGCGGRATPGTVARPQTLPCSRHQRVSVLRGQTFRGAAYHAGGPTSGVRSAFDEAFRSASDLGSEIHDHVEDRVCQNLVRYGSLCNLVFWGGILSWAIKIAIVDYYTEALPVEVQLAKQERELIAAERRLALAEIRSQRLHSAVLTECVDGVAKLWNIETGELIRTCKARSNCLIQTTFSSDDSLILTGMTSGTVKLWKAQCGSHIRTFVGHTGRVRTVVFSSDDKRGLTASDDGTARIWDTATGECLHILKGHKGIVFSAVFSKDGDTVLTCSQDFLAKIWNAKTGECYNTLTGHEGWVLSAAFSDDGEGIVTASADRTAKLWDTEYGHFRRTFAGHKHWVFSAAFSKDGFSICTSSADCTAKVWSRDTAACLNTMTGHLGHTHPVRSVVFIEDGQRAPRVPTRRRFGGGLSQAAPFLIQEDH